VVQTGLTVPCQIHDIAGVREQFDEQLGQLRIVLYQQQRGAEPRIGGRCLSHVGIVARRFSELSQISR
jgi:hypothetical protein